MESNFEKQLNELDEIEKKRIEKLSLLTPENVLSSLIDLYVNELAEVVREHIQIHGIQIIISDDNVEKLENYLEENKPTGYDGFITKLKDKDAPETN